jgi:hypothetical protein
MSKVSAWSYLIAVTLFFSGCGNSESKVIGKWKVDTSDMPQILRVALEKNATRLEFRSDHTLAVSNFMGAGGTITWSLAGNTISLSNSQKEALFFTDKDKFTLSDDGKLLSLQMDGGGKPMRFQRE